MRVVNFGAFVEILPGVEGLLHISEIEDRRIGEVRDVMDEGDETLVKVIDIDAQGRVRLSRRAVLKEQAGGSSSPSESGEAVGVGADAKRSGDRRPGDPPRRGSGDRGPRRGRGGRERS